MCYLTLMLIYVLLSNNFFSSAEALSIIYSFACHYVGMKTYLFVCHYVRMKPIVLLLLLYLELEWILRSGTSSK